jgi:integrase
MKKQDINAVLNPRPHFATMSDLPGEKEHGLTRFTNAIEQLSKSDPMAAIAAQIMIDHGCRVSEVLKLKAEDILPDGSFIIRAGKKGNTRVIKMHQHTALFLKFRHSGCRPFEYLTRFRMYDLFLKVGLVLQKTGSKYKKVTHSLRHAKAQFLEKQGLKETEIQTHLAQKSATSTKHYLAKSPINTKTK